MVYFLLKALNAPPSGTSIRTESYDNVEDSWVPDQVQKKRRGRGSSSKKKKNQ